jgi:hypothetical protein
MIAQGSVSYLHHLFTTVRVSFVNIGFVNK